MIYSQTEIGDVRYNAADQCFEALVTFHTQDGRIRIASTYEAPISISFEVASNGLWQSALRSLNAPFALRAKMLPERQSPAQTRIRKSPFQRLSEVFLPTAA